MKKIIFISFFLICSNFLKCQSISESLQFNYNQSPKEVPFRLFPTSNNWNFLKLDTRNGRLWQIQFSMENDKRFETIIDIEPLVSTEEEINDRFTLYPTSNIFTFILLDQINGYSYQVQMITNISIGLREKIE